jgi:quercetin dioxygenase-like cupin family protein
MRIRESSLVKWGPAPAEYFTGRAWFGPLVEEGGPINVLGVGFEPTARTHWHSHPGGQVLHCVSGNGVVANQAGDRVGLTAGDTVEVPPGELHWHGAGVDAPMVHLSITVGPTEWTGRAVTDEEYLDVR